MTDTDRMVKLSTLPGLLKLADTVTPEIARTVRTEAGDLPVWLVTGPAGVITYRPAGGASMIDYHSLTPQYAGDEREACHMFADCCHDAGTEGWKLARLHAELGEEAVWAALESWYAQDMAASGKTPETDAPLPDRCAFHGGEGDGGEFCDECAEAAS